MEDMQVTVRDKYIIIRHQYLILFLSKAGKKCNQLFLCGTQQKRILFSNNNGTHSTADTPTTSSTVDSVITETGSGQLTDSVWFSHILPALMGHIIALLHFWGSLSDTSRHANMKGDIEMIVYQFNRARKTRRQLGWSHQDVPQHARPHQPQLILSQWVKRVSWCVGVEDGLVWSWMKN